MDTDARGSRIATVLDGAAMAVMALSAVMMVLLIAIFGWLVFGRYVLNATPTWVEQLSLLIVVWITFLGAAVGVRRGSHLSVDFIREAMPPGLRTVMTVFAVAAMCAFGVVMAWQGYVMLERTAQRQIPLLGISEAWRAVPVIVSGCLIALFALDELARTLRGGSS